MRFPMRLTPALKPLFALFGGTQEQSYVEVTDDTVRFHFGPTFDETVQISEIDAARERSWNMWYGLGWRLYPKWGVGLVGSLDGVVEIRFKRPHTMRILSVVPYKAQRISVSLQDPQGFLDALRQGKPIAA